MAFIEEILMNVFAAGIFVFKRFALKAFHLRLYANLNENKGLIKPFLPPFGYQCLWLFNVRENVVS